MQKTDVLIIGCGIAGCSAALSLAEQDVQISLVSPSLDASASSSYWAQGGIIHQGPGDSPDKLKQDILEAGAGLCHGRAVEQLVEMGPRLVEELLIKQLDVDFDRTPEGEFDYTEEAAHSGPRILHHRDQTGRAILDSMLARLQRYPNVTFLRGYTAVDLISLAHHSTKFTDIYRKPTCVGAYLLNAESNEVETYLAKETILATGGIGEVYLHSTNPASARGDGLAMAYRAGARIMNLEFVQFHPTSLNTPNERRFLLSETLRGEGAELLNENYEPFMQRYDERGSLAPRDIVARGIYQEMLHASADHVWLDISRKDPDWVRQRFPSIYQHCIERHIDMTQEPMPVVPAAHYSCGGVAVDRVGQTSLHRLRAIGEVSCTGVHGANRLASASLLEGLVWGRACAEDIGQQLRRFAYYFPPVNDWVMATDEVDPALVHQDWTTIKQTMWNYVGLVRTRRRLRRAESMLQELKREIDNFYDEATLTPNLLGLRNGVLAALLVTQGALRNRHSQGCHYRVD